MKKMIAVVLMLCLLIPAAVAEAPDVKSLSDDELKALYKDVKAELMERKLWDSSVLPMGLYRAGIDLPEGVYECVPLKSGYFELFDSYETFIEKNSGLRTLYFKENEVFTMSLIGNVCYFVSENCTVRPYSGLVW